MPDLSTAVSIVDRSLPSGERYIFLTEAAFDGGAGEGDFINSNGPDLIDVVNSLGYRGKTIEIYFTEATGTAGDSYTLTLLVNPTLTVYKTGSSTYKNPLEMPITEWDKPKTYANQSTPISIIAQAGQSVTWSQTFARGIDEIQIDGSAVATGALGSLTITVR